MILYCSLFILSFFLSFLEMTFTYLNHHRLLCLCLTVLIILLSLINYSSKSKPIYIHEQDSRLLVSQAILDRRLISTLVASQASIFCPLFIMLIPPSQTISITEKICQVFMPLGLAASWIFAILFDLKTMTDDCCVFMLAHGLKYIISLLFTIESCIMFINPQEHIELVPEAQEKV